MTVTSSDTRVAPASALNAAAPKRQQVYTDQAALPPIPSYRNGSVESEDHLRGIYTLPSNDPENPQRQQKSGAGNSPYFSGKIVANILAVIQIALVLLFAIFVYYEEETVTAISKSYIESQRPTQRPNYDNNFYNPNHNERPSYGNEDSRYDHEPGPIYQPAGTTIQDSTQNLHQFYYCKWKMPNYLISKDAELIGSLMMPLIFNIIQIFFFMKFLLLCTDIFFEWHPPTKKCTKI